MTLVPSAGTLQFASTLPQILLLASSVKTDFEKVLALVVVAVVAVMVVVAEIVMMVAAAVAVVGVEGVLEEVAIRLL